MGDERCSRSRSRSRSSSPNSKSRRKSKSPAAAKKRGRPRVHPIRSPSKKRKVGRPKRAVDVVSPTILPLPDHRDQNVKPKKMKQPLSKKKAKDEDSEEKETFDPNYIAPTTRTLRNQEDIDNARAQCKRPDPKNVMATYNSKMNNPQASNKMLTENTFDIARLMFLNPVNYHQDSFQGQEFIRLSINKKLIKHLVEISWSLIRRSQLHYNVINPYFPRFEGTISIDEEFRSFMQLENYVEENKRVLSEQEYENVFYGQQDALNEQNVPDDAIETGFEEEMQMIMPNPFDVLDDILDA